MKKPRTRTEAINRFEGRLERVSLSEARDQLYEKFRTNCRMLRAQKGWSGVEAGEKIGLKDGKRMITLEYGKGNPTIEEVMLISKCFDITIDDLMHKTAEITFK